MKLDTAQVLVTKKPEEVTIAIQPPKATVVVGRQQGFTVTVEGADDKTVTMAVDPKTVGSIEPPREKGGPWTYKAPATIEQQTSVTIIATSKADPTTSTKAEVTITRAGIPQPPSRPISQVTKRTGSEAKASRTKRRSNSTPSND